MYTQEEINRIVENYLGALEFPAQPRELFEPIEYSIGTGGKRLRPVVVMMACNLFTDKTEQALGCAAAVEVFHNFTLLHDDIMDNADVRRGRPSVHRKWSPNTAILSGDAMMIYAYSLLETVDKELLPSIFAEFNRMAMEVCEGQQYDMDFEAMDSVTMEQYLQMIELKTAALLARAAKMGAMIGGATVESAQGVYDFCKNLGIAFQIQDDLLDTYGDDLTLGKKVGGDILEGKKTFLMITALSLANIEQQTKLLDTLKSTSIEPQTKIELVRATYNSLDVQSITHQAVEEYLRQAVESLDKIAVATERTANLRKLAMGLMNRQK